jgi:hypothetical protein
MAIMVVKVSRIVAHLRPYACADVSARSIHGGADGSARTESVHAKASENTGCCCELSGALHTKAFTRSTFQEKD